MSQSYEGRGIVFSGSGRQLVAGEEGGEFGMRGGVEGEGVEGAGAKGLVGGGIGEEAEPDCLFAQDVEEALNEIGVEFLFRIE